MLTLLPVLIYYQWLSYFFSVVEYKIPIGLSGQQAVEQLQQRVEKLGAIKVGTFTVDCESYQSVQSSKLYEHTLYD